jgi:hypothetical protein
MRGEAAIRFVQKLKLLRVASATLAEAPVEQELQTRAER